MPGKVPLYLEGGTPETAAETGANVGVEISARRRAALLHARRRRVTPALRARLERADVVLFDGTLFTDDEMIAPAPATKTGRRMGHMPIDGADGSLAALADLGKRRIYIHINNTNPILIDGSPERRARRGRGLGSRRRRHGDRAVKLHHARRAGSRAARHRRAALSPPASVSPPAARRQVHQGPGAGLGAQSLLLSGDDPAEGREPDRALRRSARSAASGARAWSIMTASRKATAASRAGSSSPTGSGSTATMSPRCAGCCRARASRSMPMCISCARRRCSRRSPPRSPNCSRR